MAVYEYEILGPGGSVQGIYEVEQKMSDAPLTHHPETGAPLRRILSATFAHGSRSGDISPCASGACGVDTDFSSGGGCASGTCPFN